MSNSFNDLQDRDLIEVSENVVVHARDIKQQVRALLATNEMKRLISQYGLDGTVHHIIRQIAARAMVDKLLFLQKTNPNFEPQDQVMSHIYSIINSRILSKLKTFKSETELKKTIESTISFIAAESVVLRDRQLEFLNDSNQSGVNVFSLVKSFIQENMDKDELKKAIAAHDELLQLQKSSLFLFSDLEFKLVSEATKRLNIPNFSNLTGLKYSTISVYKTALVDSIRKLNAEKNPHNQKQIENSIRTYADILRKTIKAVGKKGFIEQESSERKELDKYIERKMSELNTKITSLIERRFKPRFLEIYSPYQKNVDDYNSRMNFINTKPPKVVAQPPLAPMPTTYHDFLKPFLDEESAAIARLKNLSPKQKEDEIKKIKKQTLSNINNGLRQLEKRAEENVKEMKYYAAPFKTVEAVLRQIEKHINGLPSFLFSEKKAMLRDLQLKLRTAYLENKDVKVSDVVSQWEEEHQQSKIGQWNNHMTKSKVLFFSYKDEPTAKLIADLKKDERFVINGIKPLTQLKKFTY